MTTKEIRESLIEQAQRNCADVAFVRYQIDSYCKYVDLENELWRDIKKNGKTVTMISSTGKESDRENPAIKMALACSKERRDILKQLGLTLATISTENEEDSDI